jgi:drug/metabolite transporter (DMT)-like permease
VRGRQLLILGALAAIWGSSFMFIKVAIRDFDPATLALVRTGLAALALALVVPLRVPPRRVVALVRKNAGPLFVLALLNPAIPFWLLFWAQKRLDTGLAAILQAASPLFSAGLAFLFVRSERVAGVRMAGFVAGFAGVALLVDAVPSGSVLAALAVLLMAFLYAASGLWAARRLVGIPATVTALGVMVFSTILWIPLGILELPDRVPGWKPIASAVTLGIVCTALGYLLFYMLLARVGANRTVVVAYLVPPMALFYGATVLDEPITTTAIAGLVLILAGVGLGTGAMRLASLPGARLRRAARPRQP